MSFNKPYPIYKRRVATHNSNNDIPVYFVTPKSHRSTASQHYRQSVPESLRHRVNKFNRKRSDYWSTYFWFRSLHPQLQNLHNIKYNAYPHYRMFNEQYKIDTTSVPWYVNYSKNKYYRDYLFHQNGWGSASNKWSKQFAVMLK